MRWPATIALCACVAGCGRSPFDPVRGSGGASGGAFGMDPDRADDGASPGDGGGTGQTCEQVDFLFVIDNSGSMANNQAKLVANYSVFVGGILSTLQRLESIHVGVVTTDSYAHNDGSCQSLGGLVIDTGGPNSSDRSCGPYTEGRNYMTAADDLDVTFPCAARVGTDGSAGEAVLSAPIAAISSPLTDAGECNEGFIREGALLVLVIVSDEDADIDPEFAASAIVEAKRGRSDDIVAVALANPPDGECGVSGGNVSAFGLDTFVDLFKHGFLGPICGDYTDVFAEAVEVVAAACPDA